MKFPNERDADRDKSRTHDECSKYSPKQHLMLMNTGNLEISEDQKKHEDVVNAQRLLHQVACQELQSFFPAAPIVHAGIENKSQADPRGTHDQCFAPSDL